MEIKDIIKSDADRLFIVDPECYVIFTGESTDDIQPFIRIGNWIDMPVALIPLIENIIITDSLIGNPSHEQFNIDVRRLVSNRYIGSRATVSKFFDYQKIFDLDLTNASVVDIEKDIPVLSAAKNISNKDRFIGIFYRDGNFKVLLNKNTIFDLSTIIKKPITNHNFHDILSEAHKRTKRYDGSGLVIVGHNPIFYHKRYFYSYLFPDSYFGEFSALSIDPGKIQLLIYPSLNLSNLSKFFKWLNHYNKKIQIFTNNSDIGFVKNLFSNSTIKNENFSSFVHNTRTGLLIKNYPDTYNLRLKFDAISPDGNGITAAFIKGPSGIKTIIKEKPDVLLIAYTAFEDINLVLKSTDIPYAIIDDGNINIGKLGKRDHIILRKGIRYEFRSYGNFKDIIALPEIGDEAAPEVRTDPDALADSIPLLVKKYGTDNSGLKSLFNLQTLVRIHLGNTKNRKAAARLKNAADLLTKALDRPGVFSDATCCDMILAVYHDAIYPVMIACDEADTLAASPLFDEIKAADDNRIGISNKEMQEHYDRILSDRDRLQKLISLYVSSEQYNKKNMPELGKLDAAIAERKEDYQKERLSLNHGRERAAKPGLDALNAVKGRLKSKSTTPSGRGGSLRRIVKIGVPILILLIAAALLLVLFPPDIDKLITARSERVVQSHEIDTQYRALGKKYNIRVRDNDILNYVNRVAINNGYHKIAATKIREKNPDWIFPENVFVMLDGQKVTVSKGDTLWNLSKNKIIEATIKFNADMKEAETTDIKKRRLSLERALSNAYTGEQTAQVKKALEGLPVRVSPDTDK
jgi:hypothetical protein